jgi:serine phosphatase RsbU (regulator of sigma subunit)/CheY-like chemotaxis protein/anti-sigma regulatory factor (Ser/Thr protein kinase)
MSDAMGDAAIRPPVPQAPAEPVGAGPARPVAAGPARRAPAGPARPVAAGPARPIAEPLATPGILLVDDTPENLVALRAVLEPLGAPLISAASGDDALRVLLRQEVSVILLDVRMAGLDGLQTARLIRGRARTRHVPIIFLTAESSEIEEIAAAYASGAIDYVVKPVEPEILRAKVAAFVELSRERAERLRQSQARAEAEAAARTIRTLQILNDTALSHVELDGLIDALLARATTLFDASGAAMLLRHEVRPGLRVHAAHGAGLPVALGDHIALGEGTLGQLALGARPAALSDGQIVARGEQLAVPLLAAGQLLGLFLLAGERRFTDADLELLSLAADRMATAIDNVQRFAQGRQLVETLQRSLLPTELGQHPRLELAARYQPSGLAPQIGGDWYDAVDLGSDRVAVMIGDVVGHGARAATTMGELRNVLRAYAVEGHSPGAALHRLDRYVRATYGPGMLATVLVLVVDVGAETVTVSRAGHPPPALRGAEGTVRFLDTSRTLPLGVDPSEPPEERTFPLRANETLLLFTDGLVERRRESISEGFDRLVDALDEAPGGVEEICDRVLSRVLAGRPSDDDVALLAVRLLPEPTGPLELTLPAIASSIPLARHALRRWLATHAPRADRGLRQDLELAWTEAASNVVRHAYGLRDATFSLRAELQDGVVALTVTDQGRWREPRASDGGRGLGLMEAVCDSLTIDRRPDATQVVMRRRLSDAGAGSTPS